MTREAGRPDLNGVTVLILEDDFYLATDIRDALSRCGAALLGPYGGEQEALRALTDQRPHCALLDINLGAGPSFELPSRLAELSIPFAFVTGYDQSVIPARYEHVSRIEKPFEPERMPRIVTELLGQSS